LEGDAGSAVEFDHVLLLDNKGKVTVGTPIIEGAFIKAKIIEHLKGDKVMVFHKKRRKGYQKENGHRQYLSKIFIEEILEKGFKAKKKEEKPTDKAKKTVKAEKPAKVKVEKKEEKPKAKAKDETKAVAPEKKVVKETKPKAEKPAEVKKEVKTEKPKVEKKKVTPKAEKKEEVKAEAKKETKTEPKKVEKKETPKADDKKENK